jgi:hypothetical protein
MAGGDRGRDSDGDAEGGDSDVEGALGRLNTKGSPAAADAAAKKGGGKGAAQAPTTARRPAAGRQRNERVRMDAAPGLGREVRGKAMHGGWRRSGRKHAAVLHTFPWGAVSR